MLQVIDGKSVYVVDFDTMPVLPITGLIEEEAVYETLLSKARGFINPSFDAKYCRTGKYAQALNEAFENGIITEPGKYGIYFEPGTLNYSIFKIIEP